MSEAVPNLADKVQMTGYVDTDHTDSVSQINLRAESADGRVCAVEQRIIARGDRHEARTKERFQNLFKHRGGENDTSPIALFAELTVEVVSPMFRCRSRGWS